MAPCLVKDLVEGSSSHGCGGISIGDILMSVDGVPVGRLAQSTLRHSDVL